MNINTVAIPKEHERRFFPDRSTFKFDKHLYPSVFIIQSYLEDELRTRIRDEFDASTGHVYTLTRKTGEGVSRVENERTITKHKYCALFQKATCKLSKRRFFMQCEGYVAQVNFFEEKLQGYVQIEVEFQTNEDAKAFRPPNWFGLEVTEDKRHDNYALAKHGCNELL